MCSVYLFEVPEFLAHAHLEVGEVFARRARHDHVGGRHRRAPSVHRGRLGPLLGRADETDVGEEKHARILSIVWGTSNGLVSIY